MKTLLKTKLKKACIIIVLTVFIHFILQLLILPRLGFILYKNMIVKSAFSLNKTAFETVKDYALENKEYHIGKIDYPDNSLYNAPRGASFYIYTGPREFLFSTGNIETDRAIKKIHSTLTFNIIGCYGSTVVFQLVGAFSPEGQGVLYDSSGEPVRFLSGLLTVTEIENGWYYYHEARINAYPG